MKNIFLKRGTAIILAGIMSATGIAGCSRQQETQKKSIRIGVGLYRGDDTFISTLRSALEEKAKEYERETGIKVTMDIVDAKENQSTQNNQVERFISLGCDCLCVNLVDRSAASNIIDKAINSSVPVVFFNREPVEEDMSRWENLYYVGEDAKESAILQGNIVVDAYKDNPQSVDYNGDGVVRYVLLEGESSHQDSLIRTEWSVKTIKKGGVPLEKITGGIANWDRSQASALMEQWLNQYPDQIELVICNNDDMALGAIDAIKRLKVHGIQLVGIDGTPVGKDAIREGSLLGSVEADMDDYAGAIFSIAAAKALGQPVDETLKLTDGKYYNAPQMPIIKEK